MIVPSQRAMWKSDGTRKSFAAYIMSNSSMTLYIGITNDLRRRVGEHKEGTSGFTSRYRVHQLVYFEIFDYATRAIAREKQLKGWTRARKIALIKSLNPQWRDLAEDW